MKQLYVILTTLVFWIPTFAQRDKSPELLISNVNIIDVEEGVVKTGMNVFIKGDRIHDVTKSTASDEAATFIVDGTGKYLIPGLWDMHAHPDDPEMWRMNPDEGSRDLLMPLFVMHGVTGIRDMAGSLQVVNDWREKIASGTLIGPAIYAAGPLIDGPNPMWDGSIGIPSTKHVKQKVDSLIDAGVDFLKVYSLLPDTIYFAMSKYARSIEFPFCGHVPQTVTNYDASKSGINSLEHLLDIPLECSSQEERIRNRDIDYGAVNDRLGQYVFRNKLIIDTYDAEKARRLFKTFVENETWHTPTISMWYKNAWFETEKVKDQAYFKYLPAYMKKYWTPQFNDHLKFRNKEFLKVKQAMVDHYMRIIRDMNKAGVKLLAGTDTGANPLCWPGLGVHLEIEMFEKAGLSPLEALRTATINPAIYLGILEDYGTVSKGKYADLILLTENPLVSVSNTQKISGVVKSGTYFSKKRIEEYLEEIAERQ
ncbi:amidohydrolase family protein [Ekhidna sp.]|uniref:amidohydrolase family protein n=1 Tax=Ekhidna sp. TaxID=2608089 RepID=UPI003BA9C801